MSVPWGNVVRAGVEQARVELRNQLLSPLIAGYLVIPVLGLVALHFLRGVDVMGTEVSLAQVGVPGMIAMGLVTGGILGVSGDVLTEREDGTLLRAKAVPHGMRGHLIGKVIVHTVSAAVPVATLLVPAAFLFDGVTPSTAGGWITLTWVCLLGLVATVPVGAVVGSLCRRVTSLAWLSLAVYGATAISGVFYPLNALPGWLQGLGQLLPMYWVGIGTRSALLPPEAVALEIGESWRHLETVAALGVWAALGLALAPLALRRMARRQSGSQVASARERVMSRGY